MPTRAPETLQRSMERTNRAWRKKKEDASGWKSAAMTIAELALGGEPGSVDQLTGGAMGLSGPVAYASLPKYADAVRKLIKKNPDEQVKMGLQGLLRAIEEERMSQKAVEHVRSIDLSKMDKNQFGFSGPLLRRDPPMWIDPAVEPRWAEHMKYYNKGLYTPPGAKEGIEQAIHINPRYSGDSIWEAVTTPLHENWHVAWKSDPAYAVNPVVKTAEKAVPNGPGVIRTPFGMLGTWKEKTKSAGITLKHLGATPEWQKHYATPYYAMNPDEFIAVTGALSDILSMYGPAGRGYSGKLDKRIAQEIADLDIASRAPVLRKEPLLHQGSDEVPRAEDPFEAGRVGRGLAGELFEAFRGEQDALHEADLQHSGSREVKKTVPSLLEYPVGPPRGLGHHLRSLR